MLARREVGFLLTKGEDEGVRFSLRWNSIKGLGR